MNISLNWIKEFVNLSGLKVEDIKNKLTAHTVEVEQIIQQGDRFKNVVVAKILDVSKHPKADKLQIAIVDIGQEESLKIVCGAPNISTGQLVPLAMVGAILPNGLEIKKAEIRGEQSFGMLCAEDELGLGKDHAGIMILDKQAKVGQNFAEYLNLNDIVLEIDNKSISNRPDLWGHYGISRELAVLFDLKLKKYESKELKIKKQKEDIKNIEVEIKAKKLCSKYLALKIDNIKIEDSPDWLKEKLLAIGVKSINNIVDATNYVMFELGQPLHAFDSDAVDKIIVRMAEKNEKIITLDDNEKKLEENDLIIASSKEAIAVAGVIGGKNSEINNTSNSIIIESANFDAVSVRKTAQRLNSRTDAAMRFEKGLDPNLCLLAINKVAEIIKKLCPKAIFDFPIISVDNLNDKERIIELDLLWAEKIIGQKIESKEIKRILESLGLIIKEKSKNILDINIPSWRLKDLLIKEDIIEEIIRIFGYNNIVPILPKTEIIPPEKDYEMEMEGEIKNILSLGYKFSEIYNYSFVSEDQLLKLDLDPKNYIKLLNPLSSQHTLLRQTLSTNLLSNIKSNQAKYENINIFEIGNIFLNIAGGPNKDNDSSDSLPYQEKKLAIALAKDKKESFRGLKNVVFNAVYELSNGLELEFLPTESIISWADKKEKCLLILEGKEIGFLAKIDEVIAGKNGIKKETAICEIDFKNLLNIISKFGKKEYESLAKFPSINRDLAFVIDKKILFNDIKKEIKGFHDLITEVDLFDVYSGQNLEADKKSMAFHINYHSKEKTLTNEEVDVIQNNLIKKMEEKFGSKVRDF
ncbi:phenylalanine--tRNA ligase subunit beta [Candidatus Falkowbacteria bacterium HGW-Falkowbacteria-1]|uniref:Phenylalanine--tRNA ligase beta subunit n=1 Tax=Candidatus Falkowbacteria bacterium HGW-Falkowbacteria-1 TaxID=2013768 RepID=A0A2N2EA60_9BACT|nr:MAG: phenylalanine--tRNA ligase subunit beta [Candidatus Falkowbacteria bacterium HGW-Falkowbacteria-1]